MINNSSKFLIRIFDVTISLLILIILFPVILVISLLILIFNGRPVIFKQNRVGYMGKKFIILKFRTMNNLHNNNEILRLTWLGKILRKTSLDELPQLINILKKEMSIVGPRPLPETIENKLDTNIKIKRRRLLPGLTGFSQIKYTGKYRKLAEKIELDLELVNNYSLHNYFKVLLKTPYVLLIRFFKNKSSIIK